MGPPALSCIVCHVLHLIPPQHSALSRGVSFLCSLNHLFMSFFTSVSSAADKEVEDYYTRKRHLPDLAARGTLPLHVLKISQDQVGAQVLHSRVPASKQGRAL